MQFEDVLPRKIVRILQEKIFFQQQKTAVAKKRLWLGEDEFHKEKQKKPTICFSGFRCFVFNPSFIQRQGFNSDAGIDVYIIATMKPKDNPSDRVEIIASFSGKENKFALVQQ